MFMVLQAGWGVFVTLNVATTPAVPWHAPAGLLYLWLVFRYFNGHWAPSSTSARRREALRARRLTGEQWLVALAAAGAVLVFIVAFAMLNYRLIDVPEDGGDLSMYPWWTVYSILLMVSIVAGVSEESGFRGYMQGPLEERYGVALAIGLTAILFWVAHLNHPSGLARAPSLVAMGLALGALAFASRSILPSLVTHAAADSVVFVGAQAGIGPAWLWTPPPARESGVDGPFAGTVLAAGLAGIVAVLAMRRLRQATSEHR